MKKEVSFKVISEKNMKFMMNETERLCKILQHKYLMKLLCSEKEN